MTIVKCYLECEFNPEGICEMEEIILSMKIEETWSSSSYKLRCSMQRI